jgi:hypothetical protein
VRLVPLNRSQHLLALPIVLDPLRQSAPTPLPLMPLPPTITSRKAVFSNVSWEGKHPFQMSRADLQLTLIASSSNAPRTNVPDTIHRRLSPPTGPSPAYSLVGSSQHADSSSYHNKPELVTPRILYICRGHPRSCQCASGTIPGTRVPSAK